MTDFTGFGLSPALLESLARMGYTTPTPIQAQALPPALEGKDILGSAQTGTGKTASFAIPMIMRLNANPRANALVLTPTRELATQVIEVINTMLGKYSDLSTVLLIGGESMNPQTAALRQRPRIIVGTPGRINDHLERGTLMLHQSSFLVLDETDRMLDMGFIPQLEKIFHYLPKVRQTLMFSATLPDNIVKLSDKYLTSPVRVAVGATNKPAAKIDQQIIHTSTDKKYDLLLKELDARQGSILVFVKTKYGAERMARRLSRQHYSADAIHGDLQQRKREKVIEAFRDQQYRILVATDIAARGLDIPHIEHVINYDLPMCPEDYIHRIGRTARAGAEGSAVCFIAPEDGDRWKAIHRLLHPGEAMPQMPRHGNGQPANANPGKKRRRRRGGRRRGHHAAQSHATA